MTITDFISEIRLSLRSIFNEIDTWFLKDPKLREYQPVNGGWSINQILEHIGLTNHYLLILIEKGARKALEQVQKSGISLAENYEVDKQRLEQIGQHRSFEWIRPEHMEPKREKSLEEVRLLLQDQVSRCLNVLNKLPNGEGTYYKTTMSVNKLGKIDVYQYVFFLAQHGKRHLMQMQKVESEFLAALT